MNEYYKRHENNLIIWAIAHKGSLTGIAQFHTPKHCASWAKQQVEGKWYPALQKETIPWEGIENSGPCLCGTIK